MVGSVADQNVPKLKRVLDHVVRPDELFANKRRELRAGGPAPLAIELCERRPLELEPDDGGALEHVALCLWECVETSFQQRLDRRRYPIERTPFGHDGDELLDKERIPLGCLPDPLASRFVERRGGDEASDQLVGLGFGKRVE